LIDACLEPGVSVAGLALAHGINANQLRKWVKLRQDRKATETALPVLGRCAPSGFVLVLKALTQDKFRWPRRQETVVLLDAEQLHWLLDGIDLDAMARHPVRQYEFVG